MSNKTKKTVRSPQYELRCTVSGSLAKCLTRLDPNWHTADRSGRPDRRWPVFLVRHAWPVYRSLIAFSILLPKSLTGPKNQKTFIFPTFHIPVVFPRDPWWGPCILAHSLASVWLHCTRPVWVATSPESPPSRAHGPRSIRTHFRLPPLASIPLITIASC